MPPRRRWEAWQPLGLSIQIMDDTDWQGVKARADDPSPALKALAGAMDDIPQAYTRPDRARGERTLEAWNPKKKHKTTKPRAFYVVQWPDFIADNSVRIKKRTGKAAWVQVEGTKAVHPAMNEQTGDAAMMAVLNYLLEGDA